jgi:hypothetical protein
MDEAAREIEMLKTALARIASQEATFSVIGGNIIVDVDATLTDAEREAILQACDEGRWYPKDYHYINTLRSLLARLTT